MIPDTLPDSGGVLPNPDGGNIGVEVSFLDGSATLAYPDWHELEVDGVVGTLVTDDDGTLESAYTGLITLEFRISVTQSPGSVVTLGYKINENDILEMASITIPGSGVGYFITRKTIDSKAEDTVAFYITSNFEWGPTSWTYAELLGLTNGV